MSHSWAIGSLWLIALASTVRADELRIVTRPAPQPDGKSVPVYAWSVDWALRDDKEPSLGAIRTFKTLAEARAVAEKKLADNRELHKDQKAKDWTWIKYVQITGTPELTPIENLPERAARSWKSILGGLDKKADKCNLLVRDVGFAAGVKGLEDRSADLLWGYFQTTADKDGWKRVTGQPAARGKPAVSAIAEANRLASEGHLVVGVVSSKQLNGSKPKGREKLYANGHVFVVTPSGGDDWATTMIANAGTGGMESARLLHADTKVVPKWQQPLYSFFAVPIPRR